MNYNIELKNYSVRIRYTDGSKIETTEKVFPVLLHAYKTESDPSRLYDITQALDYLFERETARRKGLVWGRGKRPKLEDRDYLYWAEQQGKYVRRLVTNNKRINYEHPKGAYYAQSLTGVYGKGKSIRIEFRDNSKSKLADIVSNFDLNSSVRRYGGRYRLEVSKRKHVMSVILATYNHVDDNTRNLFDKHINLLKDYDKTFADYFS